MQTSPARPPRRSGIRPRCLAAPLLFAVCGWSNAALTLSATFTNMEVTNQATVFRFPGVNDFTWTLINGASTNFDVVADLVTPGLNSNALRIDQNGSGTFRGMLATPASQITVNIGDTLALSFRGRYYETPDNNGGGMRFGLIGGGDLDNNFYAQAGTGGSTAFGLFRDVDNDNSPGAGANVVGIPSTASGPAYGSIPSTMVVFDASFAITRTGESTYSLTAMLDGSTRTSTEDSTVGWNDYQGFFIRNGGISADYLVDDVILTLVPEPSAALLAALGSLALFRRRRGGFRALV